MTKAVKSIESRCNEYMEKYLSIPKEDRDEALAKLDNLFKNSGTVVREAIHKAVKEQLEAGFPISYGDEQGRVLRRYPDGRIFKVIRNKQTNERTEIFLRMATPEDNYWER